MYSQPAKPAEILAEKPAKKPEETPVKNTGEMQLSIPTSPASATHTSKRSMRPTTDHAISEHAKSFLLDHGIDIDGEVHVGRNLGQGHAININVLRHVPPISTCVQVRRAVDVWNDLAPVRSLIKKVETKSAISVKFCPQGIDLAASLTNHAICTIQLTVPKNSCF